MGRPMNKPTYEFDADDPLAGDMLLFAATYYAANGATQPQIKKLEDAAERFHKWRTADESAKKSTLANLTPQQPKPTTDDWESDTVPDMFRKGFDEELDLIAAINKHLITPEQHQQIVNSGYTIEELLNRRCGSFDAQTIFTEWNTKLGFTAFGA